jgi:hypothetical protein
MVLASLFCLLVRKFVNINTDFIFIYPTALKTNTSKIKKFGKNGKLFESSHFQQDYTFETKFMQSKVNSEAGYPILSRVMHKFNV